MGRVFDAAVPNEFLVGVGEDIVHFVAAHKGCSTEGDLELITCPVIVPKGLGTTLGNRDRQKRRNLWRVETIKRGVDVPAVEAGVGEIVGVGDGVLVKGSVMGMLEFEVFEAFIGRDEAVADDLDFGLVGHGLEVWMENALFAVDGLAVAVALGLRVEAVRQFSLGFGRAVSLVLKDNDLMLIERIVDNREIIVEEVTDPRSAPM